MTTLVVGLGSIGKRHVAVLKELGEEVHCVTSQSTGLCKSYHSIDQALRDHQYSRVIIANKTSDHVSSLSELMKNDYQGVALVEKPLSLNIDQLRTEPSFPTYVAYNLRFHPQTYKVQELLKEEDVLFALSYVGQYLPDWRPDRDYRETYSAKKEEGGGVLRDLSHEMDLVNYLLGKTALEYSYQDHMSSLEIDSDDYVHLCGKNNRTRHISITMNYLDRNPARTLKIVTNEKSLDFNFIEGTFVINNEQFTLENFDKNASYKNMHRDLLAGNFERFCTFDEGRIIMEDIEAIEEGSCR